MFKQFGMILLTGILRLKCRFHVVIRVALIKSASKKVEYFWNKNAIGK